MEGTKTCWHDDGRVTVKYPAGFDPFAENRRKNIYLRSGEIIPIYEFERRNWDMKLKYWRDKGEVPPMHMI